MSIFQTREVRIALMGKKTRQYISVNIKRVLLENALNCCEYRNPKTGHRCSSVYQLQIDHVKPWSLGGSDDLTNLRVLCRTHNNLVAKQAGLVQLSADS